MPYLYYDLSLLLTAAAITMSNEEVEKKETMPIVVV